MEAVDRPTGRRAILARAFSNRDIRLVELSFLAFNAAEWGTWIAILVYAYGIGGSPAAGLVAVIQLVPAALFAPFGSLLPDVYPRERMIFISYLSQAITLGITGAALLLRLPVPVIYVLAAIAGLTITLTRPVQAALLPMLADTPEVLIAANVTAGTIENISIVIGPALTGILLAVMTPGAVYLVMGAGVLAGAVALSQLHFRDTEATQRRADASGLFSSLMEGFRVVVREPNPRLLVGLLTAESIEGGALDVLFIVLAISVLGLGRPGAGYLNSAFGVGGVIGAACGVLLIGRSRIGPFLLGGGMACGLAIAATGTTSLPVIAIALIVVCGAGRALVDLSGRSLLQRVVTSGSLSRAFGALEGLTMAGLAVGSVLVPLLIRTVGVHPALFIIGALLPAAALLSWRGLARVDAASNVPIAALGRLRSLALFSGLDPPVIERLARSLIPLGVPAGEVIFRQGDVGDRFYIVDAGKVDVLVDDQLLTEMNPGEFFGEIALLRRVARTATVAAATDAKLFALEGNEFIAAVTGHPETSRSAERIVSDRLAETTPERPSSGS